MNAEEYLNQLRELDEGLWEQVLDTITDHHNKTIPDNDDGMKYYITLYDEGKVVLELYKDEQDEYPTCVECQDEKCIDFEDSLCDSCYHKSCKRAGDECWCACLDSDDPLKINDEWMWR